MFCIGVLAQRIVQLTQRQSKLSLRQSLPLDRSTTAFRTLLATGRAANEAENPAARAYYGCNLLPSWAVGRVLEPRKPFRADFACV